MAIGAISQILFNNEMGSDPSPPPKKKPKKAPSKFQKWLHIAKKVGFGILSIWGLLFSLFLFEEAFQQGTWGIFAAQNAGRYDLIDESIKVQRSIANTGKVINYAIGWTNPFSFLAYKTYFGPVADLYIESQEALIAANDNYSVALQTPDIPVSQLGDMPAVAGTIHADKALNYIGEHVSVLVPVIQTKQLEKVGFLNSPTNFTIVCFPSSQVYDQIQDYKGYWVVVSGEVELYNDKPEIIVHTTADLKKVKPFDDTALSTTTN